MCIHDSVNDVVKERKGRGGGWTSERWAKKMKEELRDIVLAYIWQNPHRYNPRKVGRCNDMGEKLHSIMARRFCYVRTKKWNITMARINTLNYVVETKEGMQCGWK
jgi:hypothetical protein